MMSANRLFPSFTSTACALLFLAASAIPAMAQDWVRNDGSVPMPLDWSHRHLVYTGGYSPERFQKMMKDPRAFASLLKHGDPNVEALARGSADPSVRANREANDYWKEHSDFNQREHDRWDRRRDRRDRRDRHDPNNPSSNDSSLKRDWSVSLGAGGVAAGMSPAKYNFDINATPSCTSDFAVFPINATSTGNVRAHVVGTFSTTVGFTGTNTAVTITITPVVGSAVLLTLNSDTSLNTGTYFKVFTTGSSPNATSEATNLAAAINRNLSGTAMGEVVAISSTNTVTVYALTAGTGVTLTRGSTLPGTMFSWAGVTAGTSNNTQANLVGFNKLYSGPTSPYCAGATYPAFIFSYASGVGPVATSPVLSLDGTKIAFVENDATLGAILHVLTFQSGSTEYGTCTVGGSSSAPTCSTHPVIPGGGNTGGSTATDYMLPLGLVGNNTKGIDSYSSPFIDYFNDIAYVGDDAGYLYKISPVFGGSQPAHLSGFPVTVSANKLTAPVVDVSNTGNIFVGDSGGFLYNYTSAGTLAATKLTAGTSTAGGIRDAPMVDSTNGVGYVVSCNGSSPSEPQITQFAFASGSLTSKAVAALNYSGDDEYSCGVPIPMYDPTPNNTYYAGGSSATGAAITACYTSHYPNLVGRGWYAGLETFQFTTGTMKTTSYGFAYNGPNGTSTTSATTCSPLTEFYGKAVSYTPSSITQSGTTVTVTTPTNLFVTGQTVTLAGVGAGTGGCTSAAAAAIDGDQTVTRLSGMQFTFTSDVSATITTGQCTLSTPTAVGPTVDYMFLGTSKPVEAFTFTLPMPTGTQTDWTGDLATNTGSVSGGTSGMTVDNDSGLGQASSIYFGTLTTSNQCGTGVYCAVKLTQAGLN